MTKTIPAWALAALPLAIGLAGFSGSANAVAFNIGEVRGQFDSQLSIGASMSTADAEKDYIHFATSVDGVDQNGQALARTSDDNRLNYESGDFFSKIFKGSHDLQLTYADSGAFFRGKYWYDFAIEDDSVDFYTDGIEQDGREPLQKGAGVALLDAFIYHNYTIGNNPGNVRLGRQVVSWGESTFIGNSINSINPIDVAAFRRPGAELKEGLMPVEMLYFSQGLTDNLTMEAFYQLKWHPYILDNCGTFFGGDTVAKGCNDRLVVSGADLPQGDPELATGGFGIAGIGFGVVLGVVGRAASDKNRSLALGLTTAAGSFGQVVGPPLASVPRVRHGLPAKAAVVPSWRRTTCTLQTMPGTARRGSAAIKGSASEECDGTSTQF